ncbi:MULTISPECIES: DUF5954 family protein [unclassified Streptomyces]|uniref:DUF5954 family protein n=1 Tax=unclassified Streptomyces TaxID=2593676 RepID=UPI002E2CE58B|nr:DUF5954 family protein [Streptomyces sp. NBC_00223]
MSGYEDSVPAYLTIRVTAQDSPIAAFADQEAWLARDLYPHLMGVGVGEFFHAREHETGGWELSEFGENRPQAARDSLGSHFRWRAKEAEDAGQEKARRAWAAAALRMDRAVVDDIRVQGERFRIVRASHFIRMGSAGPEPPRPSDPDPGEVGEAHLLASRTKGFLVDPFTGTGLSEGILKLDLVQFVGAVPGAPEEIAEDARRAAVAYPGGVLLPAVFLVSERVDGRWKLHSPGSSFSTPQGARDSLAAWLRVMAPFTHDLPEDVCARYAEAADRFDAKRAHVLSVDGQRFRITRVERLMRIGPDGPEGPRPSDFDPDPPIEVQVRQLKEQGRWKEEDDDRPFEPDERTVKLRRLWEREHARRAALKQRGGNGGSSGNGRAGGIG